MSLTRRLFLGECASSAGMERGEAFHMEATPVTRWLSIPVADGAASC